MATNITTDNLLGQFCSLIVTNAASVADVDDLLIYKYTGGTLQRITARLMRDYFLNGLSTSLGGYATTQWVTQQLTQKVGVGAFTALSNTVQNMATQVNEASAFASSHVYCTQEYYDGLEAPDPDKTYFIYEDEE